MPMQNLDLDEKVQYSLFYIVSLCVLIFCHTAFCRLIKKLDLSFDQYCAPYAANVENKKGVPNTFSQK